MEALIRFWKSLDITIVGVMLGISLAGLFTMSSFQGNDTYFVRQGIWILVSLMVFLFASMFEYRFLKQTRVVVALYGVLLFVLLLLFALGHVSKGAESGSVSAK